MNTRDIKSRLMRCLNLGDDVIQRQRGGVNDGGIGWGRGDDRLRNKRAGIEAELAALDQTQSANRDQFGITRPGTDEIDGHERVSFCVSSVVRASRCFA